MRPGRYRFLLELPDAEFPVFLVAPDKRGDVLLDAPSVSLELQRYELGGLEVRRGSAH